MLKRVEFKSLAFHILVPIMLSFIVAMIVPDYEIYYNSLLKPIPHLPQIAFPMVWSLLFLLMGIAAYLVEQTPSVEERIVTDEEKKVAFNYYFMQLLVNLLWTPIFFGLRWTFIGLLWTILLLILVFITYRKFVKINHISGYLFIPYLLWVIFATYYTFGIWLLNR